MDNYVLVTDKYADLERFAKLLESSELRPRAMVYASYTDSSDEKLLVVPALQKFDERDIYRRISIILSNNRSDYPSIDVSDTRVVPENDPYIRGLSTLFRVDEFSTISISKSVLNGIYIEHAVVFRMAL